MWSGQPVGLPGPDAMERVHLERQVLILQSIIAGFFCAGAYLGVFGAEGAARAWIVGWIAVYHAAHAVYVVRYRLTGRSVAWIETITPLGDVTCITAGWVLIGDAASPFWAIYLYALVGYARRYDGRQYGALAGFILLNLVVGRVLIATESGTAAADAQLLTMFVLTAAMGVLASAIGGAWRRAERKARSLAETDPLTGIANRRTFFERLDTLPLHRTTAFSILMLDLDNFKRLNDRHGHLYGDDVLIDVARTLANNIRPGDGIARYGGEEFVVVMPGARLHDATVAAERLRRAIADATPISVSIGCAARRPGETADSVLRRADNLLLAAKRTGKNSVRSGPLRKSA